MYSSENTITPIQFRQSASSFLGGTGEDEDGVDGNGFEEDGGVRSAIFSVMNIQMVAVCVNRCGGEENNVTLPCDTT